MTVGRLSVALLWAGALAAQIGEQSHESLVRESDHPRQ
jgi:hypothetical protein